MSLLGKKWIIKNTKDKSTFDKLLENRGMENFEELEDFYDPYLFEDMEKAVSRISKAIETHEEIVIFGDYDVDGISGAAILLHILRKLSANVSCRLPNRVDDGYGLSEKFIDEFIEKGIGLVITVDCGISCFKEIKKAREHGIDVIVTDHHTIPQSFPDDAFAVLHPRMANTHYPYSELTGAGVALKLAHALIQRHMSADQQEENLDSLLTFASLGTVADLGPLKGENRLIVKRGLNNFRNPKWPGLKRLKELANLNDGDLVDTTSVGFRIAPRINAAGRIGDPYTALNLLLQEDDEAKVMSLGQELEDLNKQRQDITQQAIDEAENHFRNAESMPSILIAASPDWHVGILGLVAGKLAERHGRPSIILQDLGDTFVASARSPQYFNIIEAIGTCSEYLISHGGHAQAAGFNIKKENYEKFKEKISEYAAEKLKGIEIRPTLEIDCEVFGDELSLDFIEKITGLAPFGVGNEKPVFVLKNLHPQFISKVGNDGSHLRVILQTGRITLPTIAFRMGEFADVIKGHSLVDIVCHVEKNTWNGKTNLQLHALDFSVGQE